jgi:polar amino acid transport system substrate-binding protein
LISFIISIAIPDNLPLNSKNSGVFSTGRTKDRESSFKWIGPIGKTKYIFFTNVQNDYYIGNPNEAELKAKHILVSKNDVSHQILTNLGIKNLKVSDDKSSKENIQSVAKDKDVLWASDYYSGIYKIRKLGLESKIKPMMSNRPFIATTMNIAFNINTDEKIIEDWSKALKEIIDDGTYAKIMQKYE